jgi:hypothetical protein
MVGEARHRGIELAVSDSAFGGFDVRFEQEAARVLEMDPAMLKVYLGKPEVAVVWPIPPSQSIAGS